MRTDAVVGLWPLLLHPSEPSARSAPPAGRCAAAWPPPAGCGRGEGQEEASGAAALETATLHRCSVAVFSRAPAVFLSFFQQGARRRRSPLAGRRRCQRFIGRDLQAPHPGAKLGAAPARGAGRRKRGQSGWLRQSDGDGAPPPAAQEPAHHCLNGSTADW